MSEKDPGCSTSSDRKEGTAAVDGGSATTNCGTTTNIISSTTASSSAAAVIGSTTVNDGSASADSGPENRRNNCFAKWQSSHLEKEFNLCKNPTHQRLVMIASATQLQERQVKNWFIRRRVKQKKDEQAIDLTTRINGPPVCPYSPMVPPSAPIPIHPPVLVPSMNANLSAQGRERIEHWIHYGHQFPPGALRGLFASTQQVVPNNYVPVDVFRDEIPWQQQPGARQVGRNRSRSPRPNEDLRDGVPQLQLTDAQLAGRDRSSTPVAQDLSHGVPRQQLPDARPLGDHSRSIVNHDPSRGVPRQQLSETRLVGGARSSSLANHDPSRGVPRQQLSESRLAGGDRSRSIVNHDPSRGVPRQQLPESRLVGGARSSSLANHDPSRGVPWQQFPGDRPLGRNRSHSAVNQGSRHGVPWQQLPGARPVGTDDIFSPLFIQIPIGGVTRKEMENKSEAQRGAPVSVDDQSEHNNNVATRRRFWYAHSY